MSDSFIPVNELEWVTTKIMKTSEEGPESEHIYAYELDLFRPLADWDVFAGGWERERIESMQKHIRQGDVVFDVGAEQGWMSALISKYMSSKVVLVEPTREFWPGIGAIFDRNSLQPPINFYKGFFSNTNENEMQGFLTNDIDDQVIEKRKYRNLWDKDDNIIPSITIDTYVNLLTCIPDHITIDVEGAELLVLMGAEQTLKKHQPLVWCSIHEDMMLRDYGHTKAELLFFMEDQGYDYELLAVDHESHYFLYPKG